HVVITDNGVGIPEDKLQKVFDPFYTTKDIGKGTGLGLSIVSGIVTKLGGTASVVSRPGATAFEIVLRVAEMTAMKANSPDREALEEIGAEQGVLTMVISDQQIPQMKGTAFLARIRERTPDCIRVLLTGHAGLESAITAINDRLLDKYLTKPVDNEHDFTVSI